MIKIKTSLEEVIDILYEDGFFALAHGTGRNGNNEKVIESIFQNGLRTKDNSLYYTTIGLDKLSVSSLKDKLNNWPHLNSKKIILIRIPIEYINIYGDSADLEGEKYGAFMIPRREGAKEVNYLDPKFILGSYDVESELVVLNPNFEKELSEETTTELNQKYKKVLAKFKERIKRQSEALSMMGFKESTITSDDMVFDYEPTEEELNNISNRN